MSEENGIVITNQSTIPESAIPANPSLSPDDIPIGGGSKFNFSEYPSQNDVPPPKKPVARKPLKAAKKEEIPPENKEEVSAKTTQPLDEIPVGGNNVNTFDDKPIAKGNFNISQFPEGGEAAPVVETNYTMTQMLKSKANKLKLSGLQALLKMLEEDPSNGQLSDVTIAGLLKQTVPANLQKSLQCMMAWMKNGRGWGEQQARNVIQYGYIGGKANTKKYAMQIVDQMYEDKGEVIEMTILLGFKSKTAKNIAGYNAVLNQLIAIYGVKRLKYLKPYLSQVLRVISTEKLPAVKTEAMNTLKEAYKWMSREVVEPMLKDIKEAQKKELDAFWQGYDKTIVMKAPKDIPDEVGKNKGKKVDAYDLSEAVDIFKKFNEKWSDGVINAPKWNEKTKMMEDFVKQASVPKLANTDSRPATEVIRRLINDSNFNVVLWVLKMIGVLSKGLRRPFGPFAKSNFSNILAKFRDKKTQMIDETFKCLADLNYCLSLEEVMQDVKEGFADKAPNMRINMLNWLGKYVQQKAEEKAGEVPDKTKDAIKQLFPVFEKLLNQGVAEVRENAVKCVSKLEMFLGEDFFSVIKAKNKKLADKIGNEPKETKATKESSIKETKKEELSKSQVSLKPQQSKQMIKSKLVEKDKQKEKQQPVKQLESFDEPTFEQSLQTLIGLGYPQQQIKKITSANANDRGSILTYMRDNPYENFNDVIRVIRKAYKEWREVNLSMNKDLIAFLEERQSDIGKPQAYVIIPYIIEKMGDSKFAEQLTRLSVFMCKSIPPKFIIGHMIRYARSTEGKKPKLNSDTCVLLAKIIEAVTISNCNIKELIDFAKETYAVPFSKKGGAELFVCIYTYIGDSIKTYLDEATAKGMEGEFKITKVLAEDQKKPAIQFEGEAAIECKIIPNKKVESKSEGKSKDISNEIVKLLPSMNDNGNWQKRKDAAESLSCLLDQGGKFSFGNTINDLLATLKIRINDPNKQLIKIFVHVTGQVLCALPQKQLKFNARNFVASLIEGLNDKNDLNRKEIIITLSKLGDTIGKEALLSTLGPSLEGDRDGRLEVLNLILTLQEGIPKADIKDYAKGLTNCLCDKNKDIRAGAEKVFEKVYEKLGLETFRSIASNQKPAVQKDLNLFLDKFDRKDVTSSSFYSKGPSPNKLNNEKSSIKEKEKSRLTMTQQPQIQQVAPAPPLSAKKRSLSRNNTQKSFVEGEDDPHAATVTGTFMASKRTMVEGNEIFANIKYLTAERGDRQATMDDYCWRLDQIKENQEQQIRNEIEKLICGDLSRKMLSFDYKRVYEGVVQLAKLINKDVSYHNQIRELYDVIFKWILMRLWGGQPGMVSTIELVAPVLTVLEKKKLALTDFEVEMVITIIREYLISAMMTGFRFSESLYNILKCLVALSSGEKVLRKVLHQFTVELSSLHKHLKKDNCQFYREAFSKLVKSQLIDYVGNSDTLEEVSKIKQLKEDPEFNQILFGRLHPNVLTSFGFKRIQNLGGSGVNQPNVQATNINNASFTSDREEKNRSLDRNEKLPPRGHQSSNTMVELRPSVAPSAPPRKNPPIPSQIHSQISQKIQQPSKIHIEDMVKQSSAPEHIKNCYETQNLNICLYPAPHPASPLGKNLAKLVPPTEQAFNFFTTLFQENSEKIVNQLTVNAKFIFGSILKSVYEVISARRDYPPDKLVAQITLLQNCIKCPHIVHNIGELLGFGTSFALTQLVYEDEHKAEIVEELRSRNIDYKSDNFIKAINGVMLRLLENVNPQQIVNILIELLTIHSRTAAPSAKTISLIVKCLGRVASGFCKDLRHEAVKIFLIKANEYLTSIDYDTPLEQLNTSQRDRVRPEDSAANSIKSIITEICNSINSDIWDVYEKAVMEARFTDRYISSYLNSLNVRVPERPRVRSQAKQNEELKKINELLSKTKSYETGIAQLRKYVEKHPEFAPVEYFTSLNYDQKFIAMVVRSLQGTQRLTPAKDRDQTQENVQEKIQKLKKKFQQLQPEVAPEVPVSRRQNGEQQQREQRAQEIKRRIEEMKNKMTNAVNRGRP